MGGFISFPETDEQYHELMDIAEGMVNRDIHEKCMHASGEIKNNINLHNHQFCLIKFLLQSFSKTNFFSIKFLLNAK